MDALATMAVDRGTFGFCADCDSMQPLRGVGGTCSTCGSSSVLVHQNLSAHLEREKPAAEERSRFLRRKERCIEGCASSGPAWWKNRLAKAEGR